MEVSLRIAVLLIAGALALVAGPSPSRALSVVAPEITVDQSPNIVQVDRRCGVHGHWVRGHRLRDGRYIRGHCVRYRHR